MRATLIWLGQSTGCVVWTKFRIIISCFFSYKCCCHHNLVDKETKVQTIKGQCDGGFTFLPGTYLNSFLDEQLEQCFFTFSTFIVLQILQGIKVGFGYYYYFSTVAWAFFQGIHTLGTLAKWKSKQH